MTIETKNVSDRSHAHK